MSLTIDSRVELNDGNKMPLFGLGVWQTPAGQTAEAVEFALKTGYRLIDTAKIYGNEEDVGRAVRQSEIPRDEIFVTTKLWNSDQGYDSALRACDESLKKLGMKSVDLYLIHWPIAGKRLHSWKALTELKAAGKCQSIGVSNFTIEHLEELLEVSDVVPAVNQVEFNVFLFQKELLSFCRKHKIRLEAYSPLTHGEKLKDPRLSGVAAKYDKSPAQILIRWVLQHEVIVIPKSSNPGRIKENADIFNFSISNQDMETLDQLNEDLRTCWDPTDTP